MNLTDQDTIHGESFDLDDILREYHTASDSDESAQSYQIPAPKPAQKRSSLPSEEEVRAYLASYARGEAEPSFEPRPQAGPEPPKVDSRFHLGQSRAERRTMRYGGAEVDSSPDRNYRPPRSETNITTNVAPGQEDDAQDQGRPPLLFDRWKEKLDARRRDNAMREAEQREKDRKITVSEPVELILPGEKPRPEPPKEEPRPLDEESAPERPLPSDAAENRVGDADSTADEGENEAPGTAVDEEPEQATDEAQKKRERASFTPSWSRSAASTREYASLFPDTSASPAFYAEKTKEDVVTEDGDARNPMKSDRFFPANFREYLTTLMTTVFYGLRKGTETIITAEEDDEDLGPEATPANASRYYGRYTRSLRNRLRLCGVLLLPMIWISLGLPVFGQLANIRVAAYVCLALQLTILLLCQDVVTGGVMNAVHRRFGADSMAVLACVMTSLDALLVGTGRLTQPHMPLCLISSLSVVGLLLASLLSCRGLRKALRVPAIAKRAYTVTGEMSAKDRGTTILKSQRSYTGFVRRSEEAPPDETLFQKMGLPMLVLIVLLALITMVATRNVKDGIYILSVMICAAAPFCALLCFALPFFNGSFRIFPSGAAIAGWSGVCDVGRSKNLIITDRDLFPDGTVDIDQVRIFADAKPETIISYAGSMLIACGSCVSKSFGDLMVKHNCAMRQIEDFEYLPGGGMKGVIDSRVILCGSSELMQLMNVRLPFRLINRTSILLAVDGILYGIFNIKYDADPQVRRALMRTIRSSRHPIFAIRDFNVTPAMLHDTFDVATDGYDFPPYIERFAISSAKPGEGSKVAAVVCRDGLGPLSNMADLGHKMYVATKTSLYISAISAVLGVLICFLRLLSVGGVGVGFLLLFMLLCALPVLILGTALNLD